MLFIGGSKDGSNIEVKPDIRIFRVPVLLGEEPFSLDLQDYIDKEIRYKQEIYEVMSFRGELQMFYVMVIKGMTTDQVFQNLFDNYNPKNKEE